MRIFYFFETSDNKINEGIHQHEGKATGKMAPLPSKKENREHSSHISQASELPNCSHAEQKKSSIIYKHIYTF